MSKKESRDAVYSPACEDLIKGMGLVFTNSAVYGFSHSVTKNTLPPCFTALSRALDASPRVDIVLSEEGLIVNGHVIEASRVVAQSFCKQLRLIEITSFSIDKGTLGKRASTA